MKTIWKFPIEGAMTELSLPLGAQILSFQNQGGTEHEKGSLCVWILLDPGADKEKRKFIILGTGHETEAKDLNYVGTTQQFNGELVWHLFEVL